MKVQIEMKDDWKMRLSFEFIATILSLEERIALTERMRDASAAFLPPPVNLLSFHAINHMWKTGNGAAVNVAAQVGTIRRLDYAKSGIGGMNTTWLTAEVDLFHNPEVINRLAQHASSKQDDPIWTIRDDFAVFPRMRVNVIPESQPRMGEQNRRVRFGGYGQIQGLDCVYGVTPQKILQSISDARYAKKHAGDLPTR